MTTSPINAAELSLIDVLTLLAQHNIQLSLENEQLKIIAAKGAVTPELMQVLKFHKPALLAWAQEKQEQQNSLPNITPVSRDSAIPLSFNQQRLLFIHALAPETASYNMPMALRLRGQLNIPALENAMNHLLQRHEQFRTIFTQDGENAYQKSISIPTWTFNAEALSNENNINQLIQTEASLPFVLTENLLYRTKCWQLNPLDFIFMVTLHHSIADAVSIENILTDLAALYYAEINNTPSPLPPLPIQYADYAYWQQHTLKEHFLTAQLSYWKKQLHNAPNLLHIPTDKPRPAIQTQNGAIIHRKINTAIVSRAKEFALKNNYTPFMIFLAAQQLLLGRYAKQEDVCIGVPIAGRHHKGTEKLVGFFVNNLILRTQFSDNPSVDEFFKRVKQTVLDGFSHQDTPFEMVIEQQSIERSNAYSPIVQMGFNYITQTLDTSALQKLTVGDLDIEVLQQQKVEAKYDMIWGLHDSTEMTISIEYNTDLFLATTIEQYIKHFEQLLGNMLNDITLPVQKISLIDDSALMEELIYPEHPLYNAVERILPLTPMQRDLTLDTLFDPRNRRNYFGWIQRIPLLINHAIFQQAIDLITAQFSSLRMRIVSTNKDYLDLAYAAIVKPHHELSLIKVKNLDWSNDNLTESEFNTRCNELAFDPYDLANEPIIRFFIIQETSNTCAIVLTAHHACIDGISLQTVTENYTAAYEALINNTTCTLSKDNYASYVFEQVKHCDNQTSYSFWQQQAQDIQGLTSHLTSDSCVEPNTTHRSYHFIEFNDSAEHFAAIKSYCENHNTSPFVYLKSLYTLMLQSYCYADEGFYFADIIAARPKTHLQEVGCYFEQRPTIIPAHVLQQNNSFTDLLNYFNDFRQQLPNDNHISNSLQTRLFSPSKPAFLYNYYLTNRYLPFLGTQSKTTFIVPEMDNAVTYTAIIDDDHYLYNFTYNDNSFANLRFIERLLHLSQQILQGANTLNALSLRLPDEPLAHTETINSSRTFSSVIDMINAQVIRTPDLIAVKDTTSQLTYAELNRKANQLANYLIEAMEINVGDKIALCHSANTDFMVALLATLKTGACYIPIDPAYPAGRIEHMLNDSAAKCILAERCLSDRLSTIVFPKLFLDEISVNLTQYSFSKPVVKISLDDPLYIIYTSGSTGIPKGAVVKQRGEINLIEWYNKEFSFNEKDNVLIISAIGFDLTQKNLLSPLCVGAGVVFPELDAYDPEAIINTINAEKITLINCAPSAFYPLAESVSYFEKLRSLRLVLFGGEPIRISALLPWLENSFCATQLINMYGPTECTDISSFYRIEQPHQFLQKAIPIGKANDNISLFVADSSLRLLPQGLVGELLVGGEGVGLGYWGNPALTDEKFIHHPLAGYVYRTGDLVKQDNDGNYVFINRIDHQVKLRGLRIELGEIEFALRKVPTVKDSLVLVTDDKLVAYVITQDGKTPENWRILLANDLPEYMLPHSISALTAWPLTANGKIDRAHLPKALASSAEQFVAARTPTEEALVAIWQEMLGVEHISIHDSFFALGGHSLLAARTVTRIRDRFQQELPLREVFASPTIAAIAALLDTPAKLLDAHRSTLPPIKKMDREIFAEDVPLSFAQQRLWFIDQLDPGTALYNMPFALKISGHLNVEALANAFSALVERHETLRTRIISRNGMAYQTVDSNVKAAFNFYEVDEDEQELINRGIQFVLAPFDLASGPLFRAELLKQMHSNDYALLLSMHHIIADGWSIDILVRDLLSFYQHFSNATPLLLPTLPVQYIDYALWQREWLSGDVLQQQITYWKQQLAGNETLALPTDFSRPAHLSAEGKQYSFSLPIELSQKIRTLAQQNNVTLNMVLLAAFKILLSKYSNQTDISIGTPIANRPVSELENMIGLFINTLVIRTEINLQKSFAEYLSQVKNTSLNAYQHQDVPFELLLDELNVVRELSQTPLFQVMFIFQASSQQQQFQSTHFDNIEISALGSSEDHSTAKFDITLNMFDTPEGLKGSIEYRTRLFKAETITRLSQHFTQLLDTICLSPAKSIGELQFISAEEIHQQMDFSQGWNATQHIYPHCNALHHLFEQQVLSTPNALALIYANESLTYAELNTQANQLAHYLISQGMKDNQAVGVCLHRSLNLSIALLAVLKAGGAYVPFDPSFPIDRLNFMAQDTGIQFLLTSADVEIHADIIAPLTLLLNDNTPWQKLSTENPALDLAPENIFNIIYTSGSTGNPKGVMVPHQGIINRLRWMQFEYPINETDKVLQKTPYSFDVSVWELFWPLIQGATLVFAKPEGHKDALYLRDLINAQQITTLHFVPSMLGVFLQTVNISECHSIKQVFCSGEALQLEHTRVFYEKLPQARLHNLYGPTEASVDVSYYPCVAHEPYRSVPIGKPIHNTQLHILDNALNIVPIGISGELYIGGIGLALGYLNREELTAATFIDNPFYKTTNHPSNKLYKTGDVARYLADGNIEYLGRTDHQIKVRGLRIELGEIESRLQKQAGIRECIVVAKSPDGHAENQQLIAYLLIDDKAQNHSIEVIKKSLGAEVPEYMVPSHFIFLSEWPLSSNGKIDRKLLPLPNWNSRSSEYIAPESDVEIQLVKIWEHLLPQKTHAQKIGIHDNFFEMGGHSLLATRVIAEITQSFNIELSVRSLFEAPTIALLADLISNNEQHEQTLPPIVKVPRETPSVAQGFPLSFNQERLWFIYKMAPEAASYNMPMAMRLSGKLDISALEKSVNFLFKRHEIFQTALTEVGDTVYQRVIELPHWQANIEPLPIDTGITNIIRTEALTPFDLTQAPLARIKLWQETDHIVLMITLHHIIADAMTLETIGKELAIIYSAYSSNQPIKLPPLLFQYADFAYWQRHILQGEYLKKQLSYWRTQLQDAPALLKLPTDKPRPAQQTTNGKVFNAKLDTTTVQKLKSFALKNKLTPFMVLLAAQQLLLGRYAKQDDVCIGVPIAGRHRKGTENLVGFFVNALVIRTQFSDNPSVENFFKRVKEHVLGGFAHQDTPFEMVIQQATTQQTTTQQTTTDQINVSRSSAYNPVVQVGFNYLTFDQDIEATSHQEINGLLFEAIEQPSVDAKYDMIWAFTDSPAGISANLEFNIDLFNDSTIARYFSHFEQLLNNMMSDLTAPVLKISLIDAQHLLPEIVSSAEIDLYERVLPLTPMQRDLYLDTLFDPENRRNYFGWIQRTTEVINPALFQQAIDIITNHFTTLRMRLVSGNKDYLDIAYAAIVKPNTAACKIHVQHLDWSSENLTEKAFNTRCNNLAFVPYDLAHEPIIRFFIIKESATTSAIVLTAHHSCIDGISLQTVTDNYTKVYEALLHNREYELIPDNYANYAISQNYLCDSEKSYRFWQEQAQNIDALLPTRVLTAPLSEVKNQYHFQEIVDTAEHYTQIKDFCTNNKTTPFLYFKALYTLLLQSYCYADNGFYFADIVAARPKGHYQEVGCYFEQRPTIIKKETLEKNHTFVDLLNYLNENRKLTGNDKPISNSLQSRLFAHANTQFLFNFYLTDRHPLFNGNKSTTTFIVPEMDNAVTFAAIVDDDHLLFNFTYTDANFDDRHFVKRLLNVSQQILSHAQSSSIALNALRLELPEEMSITSVSKEVIYPCSSVISWIEAQCLKSPHAIAVSDSTVQLTYAELNTKANQLAQYLQSTQQIKKHENIAICHSANHQFLIAVLATLKLGCCYIPIDPNYPAGRIAYMLTDSASRIILSESCLENTLQSVNAEIVYLDLLQAELAQQPTVDFPHHIQIDDPLYVIYTSGSTGLPKGAMVKQRGELNLLQWYCAEFKFSANDNTLIISAIGFDLTQKNLFAPLCTGGKIVFPELDNYDPKAIIEIINDQQITLINCAPSAFYPLVESNLDFAQLSSLRTVLFGGEPIRISSLLPWLENSACSAQLINMYGPTECTDIATFYRLQTPQEFIYAPIPIGKANPNVQLYVADSSLRLLPQGFVGELLIGGEGLGLGYIGQPALTAEKFIQHPVAGLVYRTGDLVLKNAAGYFIFINRIDHQVKLRGLRIELGEIEQTLRKLSAVTDSLVLLQDEQLSAYVLTVDGLIPENWRTLIAHDLPDYMIPTGLFALKEWPLTANGKIDRKALPSINASRDTIFVAPRNAIEETLATIWREILGIENIGVYDSFFELGGHSLLAARTVSRIRDKFQQDIALRDVFFSPTIAAIAQLLQTTSTPSHLPAITTELRSQYQENSPTELRQYFPLSFAQQRLWLIEQIQAPSAMYNIPLALSLKPLHRKLNTNALSDALAMLVARHESLHTQITTIDGIGYQYLAPSKNTGLTFKTANSAKDLQQMITTYLLQPFNLFDKPLFKAQIITLEDNAVLLINMHHIISDGLSSTILLQDLAAFYQSIVTNTPALLAPLPVQYIDYSLWQIDWLKDEVLETQVKYWREQLNKVPLLELPLDFSRSAKNSTAGGLVEFTINPDTAKKLNHIAQQQNATLYMLLLSAFKLLLFRYSGQNDISIGTPVANRPHSSLENIIGFFVNTLVIRSELQPEQTFIDLLASVKETTTQAYAHQDLPFERLLDELHIVRDLSHTPLFQAFFTFQNASKDALQQSLVVSDIEISAYKPASTTPDAEILTDAKFELSLSMLDNNLETTGNLSGIFEYRKALFSASTIQNLAQHFCLLLDSIADSYFNNKANTLLTQLRFISSSEEQLQLSDSAGAWNATNAPIDLSQNVQTWFERQVLLTPDAIAVSSPNKTLSYLDFNRRVNQLAHYLKDEKQITHGARIVICQQADVDFLISVYAVIKCGACYIPIDPAQPDERIAHIIIDSSAAIILCAAPQKTRLAHFTQCVVVDEIAPRLSLKSSQNLVNTITPETSLYIIYTSGSTGIPKGVEIKHQGETNLIHWYNKEFNFSEHDKFLIISAIGFDLTQKNFFAPLCTGGSVYFPAMQDYDPVAIVNIIEQEKVSVINCAPSALYPLIEPIDNHVKLHSLKTVLLGGEPIRMDICQRWLKAIDYRCELVNMYGPTECTDISTIYRVRSAADLQCAKIPIGKPIANTQCLILDLQQQLLPLGSVGELFIAGVGIAKGYVNNPSLTQASFIKNPFYPQLTSQLLYKTGDLVRYRQDGNIEYIGRTDYQVKIRGLRIELGDIESALMSIPTIDSAIAVALKHENEDYLVAYIVEKEKTNSSTLRTNLAKHIPDYMIPSFFIALESWPLNTNGKINRKALPAPKWQQDQRDDIIAPNTDIERTALQVWQDVLKRSDISMHDNFFSIGGHSLKAAQVASRLRQIFSIDLALRDLFTAPTLSELSLLIEQRKTLTVKLPPIVKADRQQVLPLSYAQQRLWFLAQLDSTSPAYNMPAAFIISGALNKEALHQALNTIVARHEILRTRFIAVNGEPQLSVQESLDFSLTILLAHEESEFKLIAEQDALTPFNLAKDTLLRVTLVELLNPKVALQAQKHALLLNMHHIISDGVSIQVLIKELGTLYISYCKNLPNPLPELSLQYADYALWQRQWLQGEVLEQEIDYWRHTLKNVPILLNMPIDFPRPAVQTNNGALYKTTIDSELAKKLREFSVSQSCTLFMTCLAAYQLLLHKYSHQEDICVGIPLAGRGIQGIEELIGFFINALAIRTDLSSNLSVTELIQRVKCTTLSAFAHDQVPVEMLINALDIDRNLSFTPVIQCAFNMMTINDSVLPDGLNELLGDTKIELLETQSVIAKFDILFSMLDTENTLNLSVEYNTDLYKPETIALFVSHYIDLLSIFVNAPDQRIQQIHLGEFTLPFGYEKTLPLTPMQRDIYLASLANPDTLENSLGFVFEIPYAVDEKIWHKVLIDIAAQFDILRANVIVNTTPYQDIAYLAIRPVSASSNIDFAVLDWSTENLAPDILQQRLENLVSKPYNVIHNARTSYRLIKLSATHYWGTMAAHHMMLDGYAAVLQGTYLTSRYEQIIKGANTPFIEEDYFAASISEQLSEFDKPDTVDFWQNKMQSVAGLQAQSYNSTVHAQEQLQHETRLLSLTIPEAHYKALKPYCKKFKITPTLYFKCLYALLIQEYTRAEQNFVITEFQSGRNKTNANSLGCFYNTNPTIIDINSLQNSIASLFESARQQQKEIRDHLQISSLKQQQMMPQSGVYFSYNYLLLPHFSTMLGETLHGTRYTPNADGVVDFRVQAWGDELCFWLAYNTRIFDDKHFLNRMLSISTQLLQNDIPFISQLDFTLADEIKTLSAPMVDKLDLLPMQIALQAHFNRERTAVICGSQSLTYTQLQNQSNAMANLLLAQGVNIGDRIGICLGRRVELIVAIIASIKVGACYIPMDPNYPAERLAYMLNDSSASILITESCLLPSLPPMNTRIFNIDTVDLSQASNKLPLVNVSLDNLLYMIYTSGSTGLPKGASVYHRSEVNLLKWYTDEFKFTKDDKTLIISSSGFDLTQKNFFALLTVGGTIVLPEFEHYDPSAIVELIDTHKITTINCAPSAFYPLVEITATQRLTSLRTVLFGGEPIHLKRLSLWISSVEFNCSIVNMYGPTECTDISTFHTLTSTSLKNIIAQYEDIEFEFPLGKPSAGVTLQILNEKNQHTPQGLVGELCVSGISVGAGYWNKPELTAKAFINNPYSVGDVDKVLYHTGDLVRLEIEHGEPILYYIGRKDFQVKLRGLRIELGEIENSLRSLPAILDTLVMVDDEQLLGFALTSKENANNIDGWRETLRLNLPDYMIPKQLITVTEWPLTPNGKIDRTALLKLPRNELVNQFVAPRTSLEKDIATLWQEVLGVGKIGVFDNFFEAGGDSLAAVRLVARMEVRFNTKLQVASLFGAQTIAQLAHVIHNQISEWSPIVPITPPRESQGTKTPIFAVHALGAMVLSYEPLARALGKDQPFYGIQAFGFEPEQTPFTELHEMVNFYTSAIKQQQPHGPYQLLGHSFGGIIALEIARKLQAQGDTVAWLVLLDTHMPNKYASGAVDDALILKTFAEHNFGVVDVPLAKLRLMKPEVMINTVAERFKGLVSADFIRSAIAIIRGFQRMMIGFKPLPLNVPITLMRPTTEATGAKGLAVKISIGLKGKTLGWDKINDRVKVVEVSGDHHSMLKQPDDIVVELRKLIQL